MYFKMSLVVIILIKIINTINKKNGSSAITGNSPIFGSPKRNLYNKNLANSF